MATTQSPDSKAVGTIDAQHREPAQESVAALVSDTLQLAEWHVFRTVAECSEDTIHRLSE